MIVKSPEGGWITVRRRWFPWRLRKRQISPDAALDFVGFSDGLAGIVAGLVIGLLVVLLGGFVIMGFEAVLVVALLVPILALLRALAVIPWVVEATRGDEVLGIAKVRGWRESTERIRDIAASYERGEQPL